MKRGIFEDISEFEKRLGLPSNFYLNLLKEDDWSFVIKLNALVEGACAHALTIRLHAPELTDAFARLDLANSKFGKIAMLESLGVINATQEGILRTLAELRNTVVHNVSNVSFSFKNYIDRLDSNQLKSLIKNYGHGIKDTINIAPGKKISRAEFVRYNPKLSIWMTVGEVLACLYLEHEFAELRLQKIGLAKYAEFAQSLATMK